MMCYLEEKKCRGKKYDSYHIDGSVQERYNSSASAMELSILTLYILNWFGEIKIHLHFFILQGAHRILKIKFPDISLIFPENYQNFPWWKWCFWTYIPWTNTSHVLLLIMKTIQRMQKWLIDMEMDSIKVHFGACAKPIPIFNNFNSNHKTALNFYHWKWYGYEIGKINEISISNNPTK